MRPSLVAALILSVTMSAFGGWSSAGPTGGVVNAVVVAPSDPAVVWAGNSAGVFRSTDGGATWSDVSGPVVDVDYLAVHPNDPNRAWALTGGFPATHVYRTADGGATWIDSTDGLGAIRPTALLIDPHDPDTLYIGSACEQLFAKPPAAQSAGGAGVFKSADGGATWQISVGGGTAFANCAEQLTLDPFSPWRLFFAGPFTEQGVTESYDNGNHWERADGRRPTRAIVFDARYPFTHYGIDSAGVLVSQDGGFTWAAPVGPRTTTSAPLSLSMDPERSRIFLGTEYGVWRSGNGGTVWAKTSLQSPAVRALDFGGVPASLFAATTEGLYRMVNRGLAESRLIDLHDRATSVQNIAVDPSDPNVVYAAVRMPFLIDAPSPRGRIYRSTNGGASWERLPGDDERWKTDRLTVDAAGTLYAGETGAMPLYRRRRGEDTWTVIFGKFSDVAADPKHAGTVFLSTSSQTLRSRDSGATWTVVLDHPGQLLIDPGDPRSVFAFPYRSSDGGDTWTLLPDSSTGLANIYTVVIAPSNGAVLYRIGYRNGLTELQRSDDRATTWQTIRLPLGLPARVAVDPRDENSVWVSATTGVLDHSTDGGTTWQAVDGPFPTPATALLVFDPTGRVLHVAYPQHGLWELTTQ